MALIDMKWLWAIAVRVGYVSLAGLGVIFAVVARLVLFYGDRIVHH